MEKLNRRIACEERLLASFPCRDLVMKNNLRSRPRRQGNESFAYEEWLSRFERELRERYSYLDAGNEAERLYEKGRADMIKEILGEERRI